MSSITTIILALIITKVIDLNNVKPLDFVIIVLFIIDVSIKVLNRSKK